MIQRRIFIIGCPRSGTTLLQSLLATHSSITSFTESHFFDYGIKKPKDLPFYYANKNIVSIVQKFLVENNLDSNFIQNVLKNAPVLRFPLDFQIEKWVMYYGYVFDSICHYRGHSSWVEKTPDHLNRLEIIHKYMPESIKVHIIRDGKDVVASLYNASKSWGKNYTIDQCIQYWHKAMKKTYTFKDFPNTIIVNYKVLALKTEFVLRVLLDQIQIPYEEEMLTRYSGTLSSIVSRGETWKSKNTGLIHESSTYKSTFNKSNQKYIEQNLDYKYFRLLNKEYCLH